MSLIDMSKMAGETGNVPYTKIRAAICSSNISTLNTLCHALDMEMVTAG